MFTISGFGGPQTLGAGAFQSFIHSGRPLVSDAPSPPAPGPHPAAPSAAAAPAQLQNALKALGTMAGDPTLMKVKVDGIIGPNTVKAVNYAIKLVGGFPPYFKTPNMNVTNVRQYAGGLAQIITQHIQSRGGTVPTPVVQKAVRRSSSPAFTPMAPEPAASPFADRRWVWWVVGGVAVLVVLTMAAKVVGGGSPPARSRRRATAEA